MAIARCALSEAAIDRMRLCALLWRAEAHSKATAPFRLSARRHKRRGARPGRQFIRKSKKRRKYERLARQLTF